MELRTKFDAVIVTNPINWRDLSIRYERDEIVKGLFTMFSSLVQFPGTAYDAFITAREDQLCTKIDVDFEIRCSRFDAFETLFSGVILVQDSKNTACDDIAEVTVEQNDVNHFFFANKDFEVELDGSNEGPGLQSWHDLDLFNVPGGGISGLPAPSFGYPADDLFRDILLRNGSKIGFKSDLFTTANVSQVIRVDFTTAPAAGEIISLIVVDEWGHMHTFTCEADASPAVTWANFEKVLLLNDAGSTPTKRMGEAADVVRTPPGPPLQRYDITFHFATTISSFSAGGGIGVGTAIILTPHVFGADLVRWATSSSLRASDWFIFAAGRGATSKGRNKISFDDAFLIFGNMLDLGLTIVFDGGIWKVQVEQAEFFLDPTSALTINNVKGIIETYNDEVFGDKILLSYINNEDSPAPGTVATELSFNMPDFDCDDPLDRRTEAYNNEGEQIEQDANTTIDPDSDYAVYSDSAVGAATKFKYRVWDDLGASFVDNFYYNIPIAGDAQILRNRYTLPDITYFAGDYTKAFTTVGGFVFTSLEPATNLIEGDGFAPVQVQFEKHISFSDFKLIVDSQRITINKGDDPGDDFDCFIEKFTYNVFNGIGEFFLSTKDT